MTTNGWIYALAMFRNDGTALGQAAIEADFEPARQWVRHAALREGTATAGADDATVHPLWMTPGEPYLRGFRLCLRQGSPPCEVACDFGTPYFAIHARALSSSFVEAGLLHAGDTFRFVALALPDGRPAPVPSRLGLVVDDVSCVPRTNEASLCQMAAGCVPLGAAAADVIPALVPQAVLDEVVALTEAARPSETGGALVGRLHRDPGLRLVFVEVTRQVPAEHTEASPTRLLFTSDTWRALRSAVGDGDDELMVGWWHSHPEAVCATDGECFSEHDRAVHRTVFPAAYSLALVVNDVPGSATTLSAYGWHMGVIQRRGLYIVARCGRPHLFRPGG